MTLEIKWADKRLMEAYHLIQQVADDYRDPESDVYSSLHQALGCVEGADCDIEGIVK